MSEAGTGVPVVSVHGDAARAALGHVAPLVEDRFASRLFDRDPTLWGADAEDEAGRRLAWVGLHTESRHLVEEVASLRAELAAEGVDHVVLCGMGGSSLAPEVICGTDGVELTVLDSSAPAMVATALGDRIAATVVVVSSKSGSTVETDSQRRAFTQAFADAGIDPAGRIVVVTDPGSPLEESARADGHRVVTADPEVGGRFSALTAFGLVPSGLAGADIGRLLDEAAAAADALAADDEQNPALVLGAALGGTDPLRDKVVVVDDGSPLSGFADWAEQLVAESTGKEGTGLLPVVVEGPEAPELRAPASDVTVVRLVAPGAAGASGAAGAAGAAGAGGAAEGGSRDSVVAIDGTLGAQMLLWEVATSVAGRLLGINPFDQPDVESAKKAARSMLDGDEDAGSPDAPVFTDRGVEVRADGDWLVGHTLEDAVADLLAQLDADRGYLAVQVYLDRWAHADLAHLRTSLAARTGRPVTFGWGPRFLHSTGQMHKGGTRVGAYLQVTGEPAQDVEVPGQPFTFGRLISAQAAGDASVLADRGRPVLRLHLDDVEAGTALLRELLA